MKQRGSGAYPTQKFMPICKYRGLFRRISPAPHVPPVPPIRIHGEALCGRRKARLAEHFEVQSNVRILYTRYFVPVRCTENENFLKNLKKFRAAPMFGQISGRILRLFRARRADDAHLRCRKPCVGRCCFMFLPGLLGSPMRAARGMTALTQLLPAEGHCRRFAFDSRAPTADFTSRLSANVPLTRARFSLSSAVLLLPLPIPIVRSPPASCTAFVIAAALPVLRKAKILLSRKKKAVRRFFEPLFIFDLPLPADSESRKVKKEPHRAV